MKIFSQNKKAIQTPSFKGGNSLPPPSYGLSFLDQKPVQLKDNKTGMSDNLKSGIESLSGFDMGDVKVHYNSSKPAQFNALAYAQGNQIHLGPGNERHLPHEAWHIAQQKQGRVLPTKQMKGTAINDDKSLELEADLMGQKAMQLQQNPVLQDNKRSDGAGSTVIQRRAGIEFETGIPARTPGYNPANGVNTNWVPQDQVMLVSGHGWNIVSDNSKLEFVTDPPVSTAALAGVVNHMLTAIDGIPAITGGNQSDFSTVFNGLHPPTNYMILPYSQRVVTGSMQGTVGIPFNRLFAFFKLLTKYGLEANEKLIDYHRTLVTAQQARVSLLPDADPTKADKTQKVRENITKLHKEEDSGATAISVDDIKLYGDISTAVNEAVSDLQKGLAKIPNAAVKNAQQNNLNKLKGLLHFVGQYALYASRYTTSYKKISFPVMARSSFHSMFKDLSAFYKKQFLPLATGIIQKLGLDITQPAFLNAEIDVGVDANFTLAQWLQSIKVPETRFIPEDNGRYKTMKSDKMTAPGTDIYPTDKSMGSMKLDNGLVVVELRSLKHFTELSTHDPASARHIVTDLARLESA